MGQAKIVNAAQLDSDLTAVADAIREKTGNAELLAFPQGYTEAIGTLKLAGDDQQDTLAMYLTNQLEEYTSDVSGTTLSEGMKGSKVLKSISMPNITEMGRYMFQNCTGLTYAAFESVQVFNNYVFSGCTALETVLLPNLDAVATGTFQKCSSLKKLDLPSVYGIYPNAFADASGLETLILHLNRTVVLQNVNAFSGTPIEAGTGYIYVPASLVEQYQAANNWSTYAAQFRAIEDYPEICGGGT